MNWEEILKNIQISSQKTSSRDYVLPDEDEEDCRQWWEDLMDMCDELLDYISDNKWKKTGYRGNTTWMSKELSCREKEMITKGFVNMGSSRSFNTDRILEQELLIQNDISKSLTHMKFEYEDSDKMVGLRPSLKITIVVDNENRTSLIYEKRALFNRDHEIADITGKSVAEKIGNHINHKEKFREFIYDIDGYYIVWGDDQDSLEKSTIQIGSQKTSSRDYVLPDNDDEDCFKWWRGLFAILNRLILTVDKNATIVEPDFGDLTNEYLCQKKEELINEPVKFYTAVTGYLKYGGPVSGINSGLSIAIEDYGPHLFIGLRIQDERKVFFNKEFPIQLEENTADVKTYTNAAVFEVVKKFHVAELDLMEYVNIDGDPIMTSKLIEIYDDYLREKFDVKKNIQISGQKTSSRDYVLPDDDEDCREWWRQLHKIYNKMINAIDRNATIIIDNAVEKVDNRLLCELRDALLNEEINSDFTFTQSYGHQIKYGKEVENKGGAYIFGISLAEQPNSFRSELHIVSEYKIDGKYEALFNVKVPIWNDSILYELDRIKEKTGEGKLYAYSVVEPFLEAELEFKRHINDPNPSPYVASKLIHIYEKYLNSDVKKSINIAGQKTSSMNYVVDDGEEDCREQVLKIADKIMKFSYSDEFNMDNPVRETKNSKFYVKDYYQGMSADELNESDRLSLERHFIDKLDEETCCLILETIDKYKGQNLVEVEVPAPNADGAEKGLFIYTKEIFKESCFIQIFFPSGKHIAATLSIKLNLKNGIPPPIIIEIADIFESR